MYNDQLTKETDGRLSDGKITVYFLFNISIGMKNWKCPGKFSKLQIPIMLLIKQVEDL
jgi:hypothetical protein